ncbi:uncharacterized protein Triagg1_2211 [Trichoderma aggressivum f. europaeum]|uniref:Annexin n=1 Tax=Trichoderma aggressivum f. europaeum TaxID=173218 RepID=A0AAE1IHQ0_9HYPO|nr:hypothetical protein Triagg1_2211 [Trichoderma aggressivum f. europaeum]
MRGDGRYNRTLIRVLTNPKFQDPRALHRLKEDYYNRTNLHLADQIQQKSQGFIQVALLALLRGPLDFDVYTLQGALSGDVTNKTALDDVLLCRSNADIRAIVNKYKITSGEDLVQLIRNKVDDTLFQLYSPILFGTRTEDAVPAIYAEMEHEATEIYCLIEAPPGIDVSPIVDILASANIAQLRAMRGIYNKRYGRKLDKDISRKFSGYTEEALLHILDFVTDSGQSDVVGLWKTLEQSTWHYSTFTYRALRLYWSGIERLQGLHVASKKNSHGKLMKTQLNEKLPDGDYRDLMIALIGERSKPP